MNTINKVILSRSEAENYFRNSGLVDYDFGNLSREDFIGYLYLMSSPFHTLDQVLYNYIIEKKAQPLDYFTSTEIENLTSNMPDVYYSRITGEPMTYDDIVELVSNNPFCSSYKEYTRPTFIQGIYGLSVQDIAEQNDITVEIGE